MGAVLFLSTFYPRIVYLGRFPGMDEGYYAWQAMHFHSFLAAGQGLPPDGTLALYPLLLSWLCWLPGSVFIWLKLADLAAAIVAGWLFCGLLRSLCRNDGLALILAFVFLCAMNMEPVIDGGFKNSIFIAYVPLFAALRLALKQVENPPWCGIGALAGLGVLLREPLAIFALVGFVAIWSGWNFKAALRYALAGILIAIGVFFLAGMARGDLPGPINAYLDAGGVYAVQAGQVAKNFFSNGQRALLHFSGPLIIALYGFFAPWRITRPNFRQALFWLALALLPILEPALKIGFLYHFAVCLPGLGGLSALLWKNFPLSGAGKKIGIAVLFLGVLQALLTLPGPWRLGEALHALRHMDEPWAGREDVSNTLLAARAIQTHLPHLAGNGTFATSGFTYFLYGATGKLPPQFGAFDPADTYRLSDLARSFRALGQDPRRLAAALRQNPPDVLAVGFTAEDHEPDYHEGVIEAVKKSGMYRQEEEIRPDPAKNYGWMGYTLFTRSGGQE